MVNIKINLLGRILILSLLSLIISFNGAASQADEPSYKPIPVTAGIVVIDNSHSLFNACDYKSVKWEEGCADGKFRITGLSMIKNGKITYLNLPDIISHESLRKQPHFKYTIFFVCRESPIDKVQK